MLLVPEKQWAHTQSDSESITAARTWHYAQANKPGELKGNMACARTAVYIYKMVYPQV